MATQVGAHYLEKTQGGQGILLGGVPGVYPAEVLVLGGGVVGTNAARIAMGNGRARDHPGSLPRSACSTWTKCSRGRITTMMSTEPNIRQMVQRADLVIGAVLLPGAKAPNLITRDMLPLMKKGLGHR